MVKLNQLMFVYTRRRARYNLSTFWPLSRTLQDERDLFLHFSRGLSRLHPRPSRVERIRPPRSPCAREVGALCCRAAVSCPCQVRVRLFSPTCLSCCIFCCFSGMVLSSESARTSPPSLSSAAGACVCMIDGFRCLPASRLLSRGTDACYVRRHHAQTRENRVAVAGSCTDCAKFAHTHRQCYSGQSGRCDGSMPLGFNGGMACVGSLSQTCAVGEEGGLCWLVCFRRVSQS